MIIRMSLFFTLILGFNAHASYFPEGVFEDGKDLDSFVRGWYSYHLNSMEEPSLKDSSEVLVFRFTWLRTFHSPMAFRLTKNSGEQYDLTVKRTDGAGGYDSGKLINNERITISPAEAKVLIAKLEDECKFWSQPTQGEARGLDGSRWVFEGRRNERYHVVDRWSPDKGCLREVGLRFMELSRIDIEEVY